MALRAHVISRYLNNHGHTRHTPTTSGYDTFQGASGNDVVVRYALSTEDQALPADERREITRTNIETLEHTLSQDYVVTLFEPTTGAAYNLRVIGKRERQTFTSGLTATREIRGRAHWIHITGKCALDRQASAKAGAEARKWARDLGAAHAYRITSGYHGHGDTFRYSVCYSFGD